MIAVCGKRINFSELIEHQLNYVMFDLLFFAASPADQMVMTMRPGNFIIRLAVARLGRQDQP